MRPLILATMNRHKVIEMRALLAPHGWDVVGLDSAGIAVSWEETGDSFHANALIKVQAVKGKTPHAVLADDSGLCVDALGGAPGVYSARFAGEGASDSANNEKLLRQLAQIPPEKRQAYFICVLAFLAADMEKAKFFEGQCSGEILTAPQGCGGFGYDPLFLVKDFGVTMAELSEAEKNRVSHRGQAIKKFLQTVH